MRGVYAEGVTGIEGDWLSVGLRLYVTTPVVDWSKVIRQVDLGRWLKS